jgi:hypothetical protein
MVVRTRFELRLTVTEKQNYEWLAQMSGKSLSEFIRDRLNADFIKAQKVGK